MVVLTLRELQAGFAAHLAGADQPGLPMAVAGGGIAAAARLEVHRHHVEDSLRAALAAMFPTVHALVGADFFRRMAREFVRQSLPRQPVLADYGEGFPAFLSGYEPASALPYLADSARLDWALNLAFHAPAEPRLTAAELSTIPVERLPSMSVELAPGTTVVSSTYPLDLIWQASQPNALEGSVDLTCGPCRLLVLRRPQDAGFVTLSSAEAAFLASTVRGASLEEAAGLGFEADAAFDLAASFARLLALGAFAALQ
jgi:hypothetical protein